MQQNIPLSINQQAPGLQIAGDRLPVSGNGAYIEANHMSQGYVLVVDDDPGMHALLGVILYPLSLDVKYALNGYKALEMVARHQPGLIILDLAMPHLSGIDVLDRLGESEDTAQIPVVIFSATSDIANAAKYQWPPQVVEVLQKSKVRTTELRHLVQTRMANRVGS